MCAILSTPRFIELAKRAGQNANAVPAFIFCEQMLTGYDGAAGMGELLLRSLFECRNRLLAAQVDSGAESQPLVQTSTPEPVQPLTVPLLGKIDPSVRAFSAIIVTGGRLNRDKRLPAARCL